jgi:hypothetical protein
MNIHDYTTITMTVNYPKNTRKICVYCGAKRNISALKAVEFVTGRFIDFQCRWHCRAIK